MKLRNNISQAKFWRVPHLDNLELLKVSSSAYDYPPHFHEEFSIGLMLKGTETHICRGTSQTALPGSLILINAEEIHSNKSLKTEYRVIKIRPKMLNRIAFEVVGRNVEPSYFPDSVVKDSLMFQRLLNLHLKLEQNASPLEQESEFISTIGLLLTRQNKNFPAPKPIGKEPYYIESARNYLKSRFAENVSLAELTAITNLSPFYLLRVFHKQVGVPPHEYQTQLRIAHARKLLRRGHSISEAALETGFFDQSHLSRNFKRIVGVTPGQYISQSNIVQDPAR